MPRKSPFVILLTCKEKAELEAMAHRYTSPYYQVVLARIVLLATQGLENDQIALRLDTSRQVVSKWRKRFFEHRLDGLHDEPRRGRPPAFPPSRSHASEGAGV